MDTPIANAPALWPLVVYFGLVLLVVGGMLGLSFVLGQRHRERQTGEPYESGIMSTGSARLRFSAKFYLVAILFVIFDLEAAFLFAWAIAFRQVGWAGFFGALVFVLILLAALLYEWRQGALNWGSSVPKRLRPLERPLSPEEESENKGILGGTTPQAPRSSNTFPEE